MTKGSLFNHKIKHKSLAKIISITSPQAFRESIEKLSKNGFKLDEIRALQMAQNRATLQLRRSNLSDKERKQFEIISHIKIPWNEYGK